MMLFAFNFISFCLSYCVWGLLFAGCRFIFPIVFFCLPPVGKVGSVGYVGFLVEGPGACVPVDEARFCLPGGRAWHVDS